MLASSEPAVGWLSRTQTWLSAALPILVDSIAQLTKLMESCLLLSSSALAGNSNLLKAWSYMFIFDGLDLELTSKRMLTLVEVL